MRLCDIDGFKILFSAEIDAIDEDGDMVEIKCSKKPIVRKTVYQMFASGSKNLVTCQK